MAKIPGDLTRIAGSAAEARALLRQDAMERRAAQDRPDSIILRPEDVRGKYDAKRTLMTTLGGEPRPITDADLRAFRRNIETIGKRFEGGITARGVIDLSRGVDRDRARRQITMAVPTMARPLKRGSAVEALEVRLLTNAGPDSDVTRHHVVVHFLGYPTAIAAGRMSDRQATAQMRKDPIRFECDCGRHRYWYRYIATIGKYNAGRDETGYPKIRNPRLVGVACKHVLRVMTEIEAGLGIHQFLLRAVTKGRATEGKGRIQALKKEAEEIAKKQEARPKGRRLTGDRDYDRALDALKRKSRTVRPKHRRPAPGSKSADPRAKLIAFAKELGLTPQQAIAMLKGAQ